MKKIILVILILLLLGGGGVGTYIYISNDISKVESTDFDTVVDDQNANVNNEDELKQLEAIVEQILNEAEVKAIENENDKVNKVVEIVKLRYKGRYNPKQVQNIAIEKLG